MNSATLRLCANLLFFALATLSLSAADLTWQTEGDARVDEQGALVLTKSPDNLRARVSATSSALTVGAGAWEVALTVKSNLRSPDSSYCGSVALEWLGADGQVLDRRLVCERFGNNQWEAVAKRLAAPEGAVTARLAVAINKETAGSFWVKDWSLSAAPAEQDGAIVKRLMFTTAQLGNLLYPQDSKVVTLEVWATRELARDELNVSAVLRDYWGAEVSARMTAKLSADGRHESWHKYTARLDLARAARLVTGRYYELHAAVGGAEPLMVNHTSLAVLPEAAANAHRPADIPFTSRNWDNRIADYIKLARRLGIRTVGGTAIWGDKPPYDSTLMHAELIKQLDMAPLVMSPAHNIESRHPDWQRWDEATLRGTVRSFIQRYDGPKPLVINLGNEPHSLGDDIKVEANAYRVLYDEIKKTDPSVIVVASSAGASEDYVKAGLGAWCDAYDFHDYANAEGVRHTLEVEYPALFQKYGNAKPVWATELGLNCQGMSRQAVATGMYQILANFFAGGGAKAAWFDFLYPDPEGVNEDTNAQAFNMFDCRYKQYAPKLDALAHYNLVNTITTKKYAQDKVYLDDARLFLFRDRDGNALQIAYKGQGREDVFLPLPGVREVRVTRIDGTTTLMDADGQGLTLTLSQDPLLLNYRGGAAELPEQLGEPRCRLEHNDTLMVRGQESFVSVSGASAAQAELRPPAAWKVRKKLEQGAARFGFTIPADSATREADLTVLLKGKGRLPNGALYCRPTVSGAVSAELLPVPPSKEHAPAIRLKIHNNSAAPQTVTWNMALAGEQSLRKGNFTPVGETSAYFSRPANGTLTVSGNQSAEVTVPLANCDLYKIYHLAATVSDREGRRVQLSRPVGGFVSVPRAGTVQLDGRLDEPAWAKAQPVVLDRADQYFQLTDKVPPLWKGAKDLSANIRYLWDDEYLYLGVEVTDDIRCAGKPDGSLWDQDGLQIVVDPLRGTGRNVGKYDISFGVGANGPTAWCHMSADSTVPLGLARGIKVSTRYHDAKSGNMTYEIAIPWTYFAPFKPTAGADLGLTLAVNEDDRRPRRLSYMTWFAGVQTKAVNEVGDLILE